MDAVIHLAAYQDYLPDFSTFFHTNAVGTALLYEVIVAEKLPIRKVVVASSQAVYGEGAYCCHKHGAFRPGSRSNEQLREGRWEIGCPACGEAGKSLLTDESSVNPQNQYAVSKYTQEMIAFTLGRRYSIPTTCLRYSISQGRWQSPRNAYSGICRIFTLRVLSGKAPVVFEDGGQQRDYVHVGDVAAANLLALEDPRTEFEAYNVGGAQALTVLEYAQLVTTVLGSSVEPELPGYYRFGDTRHAVSDVQKLRDLGWRPTRGVREIIEEYANWIAESGIRDESTDENLARMIGLGTVREVGPAA